MGTTNDTESSTITTGDQSAENAATVVDVLVAARKLIEKPENWTTCVLSRDVDGAPVSAFATRAFCWCSIGAIIRAEGRGHESGACTLLAKAIGTDDITEFNDSHAHPEVLAAFDKAIELAKGNQP